MGSVSRPLKGVQGATTRFTQDLAAPLAQILSDGSASYVYGAGPDRLLARTATTRTWHLADLSLL